MLTEAGAKKADVMDNALPAGTHGRRAARAMAQSSTCMVEPWTPRACVRAENAHVSRTGQSINSGLHSGDDLGHIAGATACKPRSPAELSDARRAQRRKITESRPV